MCAITVELAAKYFSQYRSASMASFNLAGSLAASKGEKMHQYREKDLIQYIISSEKVGSNLKGKAKIITREIKLKVRGQTCTFFYQTYLNNRKAAQFGCQGLRVRTRDVHSPSGCFSLSSPASYAYQTFHLLSPTFRLAFKKV